MATLKERPGGVSAPAGEELGSRQLEALDRIIQETISAIDRSRTQIYTIAESARCEYEKVKRKLEDVRGRVAEQILLVDQLFQEERAARVLLLQADLRAFSEEAVQAAYQRAVDTRARLLAAQEKERELRAERDELERTLQRLERAVMRAEELVAQVGVVLGYLSGNLRDLTAQVESWQERFRLGLSLLKAQEDERRRLAREIHDGPAQAMAAALLRAEVCSRFLAEDRARAERELGDLKELVGSCLFDLRRIIFDLRPMTLDELGLVPAVRSWLEGWQQRTGLEVRLEVRGTERRLPAAVEIALFRVLQEAVNNVWKHSGVDRAAVSLHMDSDRVRLVVYDRGKGFDVTSLPGDTFGLAGMRERVQFLGGRWWIKSRPGRGTQVGAEIPLPRAQKPVRSQGMRASLEGEVPPWKSRSW
ncbi:MAG: sensor histidine kinase [Bacillota bacterium]|nr:sensor histidine kinase [Bacillota bacterium]MDI7248771.1 sensor histidine kinase [Bacillota bacterium]